MWPFEVGSRNEWLQAVQLGFVQAGRRDILARSVTNKNSGVSISLIGNAMDLQINSYASSLVRIYGAEEEINKKKQECGFGGGSHRPISDRNRSALDNKLVRDYAREIIQEWCNLRLKNLQLEIVKLKIPGWKHPPLDFCDTRGIIIGRIRYTSYEFALLDDLAKRGVAAPDWVLDNLRLACGLSKYPSEEFFQCGFIVYVDQFGDVFALTIPKFDQIIRDAVVSGRTEKAYVHYGKIGKGEELPGISYDFTAAWFIPAKYWMHLGRIAPDKMVNVSTSWEAKQRQKQSTSCELVAVPQNSLVLP